MLATLARADRSAGGRAPSPPGAVLSSPARVSPAIVAGVLAAAYVALPFEIKGPFHWWAMNVRVLPFLFVWLLATVAPGRLAGTGRLLLVPLNVATAAYFVYVAVDVRRV